MARIQIKKIDVFSVLKAISKNLGGSYSDEIGEAVMKLDNVNGKGTIRASEFDGGIACLAYNISFNNEINYHIAEKENKILYLIYVLEGYFHYKISDIGEFRKIGPHQNVIVEVDPIHPTIVNLPKGVVLKYLAINVNNSQGNQNLPHQKETLSDELFSICSIPKKNIPYEYSGRYSLDILRATDDFFEISKGGAIGHLLREGTVRKILGFQLVEHELTVTKKHPEGLTNKDFLGLQETVNYVKKNLGLKHSLKSLSAIAGMSEKKFQRKFKILFQQTIKEFINDLRLEKSREFLLKSEMNITEIAYELGFSNPSYYSSLFKNKFSLTPKQYKIKLMGKT